jgi:tRNA(Ile)-lysidine synthase
LTSRTIGAVLQPVAAALERTALSPASVILAAVSGGPDSVALLHALTALRPHGNFKLKAAHLNHRLRGTEADRDENFVRKLCAELDVELLIGRTRRLTAKASNLEERAREIRYAFLNRLADRHRASLIAIAHQADDQAETVLMRLIRGAGARGLAAMAENGPGRLWRPLLMVRRPAIMAYLGAIGAAWITDSSNASRTILRNRIRLELLPLLERDYAPGLAGRLAELAEEMRALDEYVSQDAQVELERRSDGGRLAVDGFARLHPALANAVLRECLRGRLGDLRRISRDHIEMMRDLCRGANPSGHVVLPGGWQLRREYGFVHLERTTLAKRGCHHGAALAKPKAQRAQGAAESARRGQGQESASCVKIPGPDAKSSKPGLVKLKERGLTRIPDCGFTFESQLTERNSSELDPLPHDATEAIFDADQLAAALAVRVVRAGDRLEPHGLAGSRKVQDLFVDRKVPRLQRAAWPLVVAGDKILWIPGITRSRFALVTAASKKVRYLRAFSPARRAVTSLPENPLAC